MKITFISLFPDLTAFGLRSVASYINREGFETQLIFLPDPSFERIQNLDERYAYRYPESTMKQVEELTGSSDLVAISLFTCYFQQAVQLTQRFKKLDIPVLWGGKHPSALPEKSLKYADMVCIGEAEEAVLELVKKMHNHEDYLNTGNFWFNTSDGIRKNTVRELTRDLDELPILNYSFCPHYVWLKEKDRIETFTPEILKNFLPCDPFNQGGRVYQIMTTRGCPYNCTYCYTFKDLYKSQRYVRQRSIDNIITELMDLKNNYDFVTHISICDDEFLAIKTDKIMEFSVKYKEKIGLALSCLASPINITDQKLGYLVHAGLRALQMGIQTASENGKKVYKRNISNEKTMAAVKTMNKYKDKIIPLYDFIIDNPYESEEDILQTLQFILQMPRPFHLDIFSLIMFPGTELYERALSDAIIDESEKSYSKVYRAFNKRYLNLVFLMFNYRLPRPVMRILISKPMVFLFKRCGLDKLLFFLINTLRKVNILRYFKKLQLLGPPIE